MARWTAHRGAGVAAAVLLPLVALLVAVHVVTGHRSPAPAALSRSAPPVRQPLPTREASYLGVYEAGFPQKWAPAAQFAAAVGRRPNIVLYYSPWNDPFQEKFARTAHAHGATVLIQMQPSGISLKKIARGAQDGYLRSFADRVRLFRHRVIIGFAHEMNGSWYSWGIKHTPPADFIAAWRHVVQLFRQRGAVNVTWLWTIHWGKVKLLRSYWPGSRYVSWIGIDGYYEQPGNTFRSLFGKTIRKVRSFAQRPILLSEDAVGPQAGNRPAKITGLFAGIRHDKLLGIVWFDRAQNNPPYHQNWRLEGDAAALAAFRRGLQSLGSSLGSARALR